MAKISKRTTARAKTRTARATTKPEEPAKTRTAKKRTAKTAAAKKKPTEPANTAAKSHTAKTAAANTRKAKTAAETRTAKKRTAKTGTATTRTAKQRRAKTATAKTTATKPTRSSRSALKKPPVRLAADRRKAKAAAGPLGDWVARLTAQIAELKAHPGVELLEHRIGSPIDASGLRLIERHLGFDLDPVVRDLYLQANGAFVVWIRRGQRGMIPKRRHLSRRELETLPPGAGVLDLAPAHAVFGKPGPVRMDYAKYMPGEPPHWGFDFPGNYYTPAYVREGDALRVKVGDDHGAAWDGPAVTLERYLENVLATWASVQARAQSFVRGKGAAIAPMTLDQVLAKYRD